MQNLTFDKTDKGREEIATRKHHLAPRLRTMLLLIDGKTATEQVLQKVAGLGLDMAGMTSLLEEGYIHQTSVAAPIPDTPQAPNTTPQSVQNPPLPPAAVNAVDPIPAAAPASPAVQTTAAAAAIDPVAAPASALVGQPVASPQSPPAQTQFATVYSYFNESIKKTIGFRGFALQLKVERASTLDDFRALRDGYIAQVKNVHGPEVAREIGDKLDLLLKPAD